jgi:hypothetical protein
MTPLTDDSLYTAFTRLTDRRDRRGQLYPLPALLTLTMMAMLCGGKTLAAVALWGRDYNPWLGLLGFRKRTAGGRYRSPCVGEVSNVFAALDVAAFEQVLTAWLQVTGDAAFTQREFCQAVLDGGGDYFVPVKDNQPALKAAMTPGSVGLFPRGSGPSGGRRTTGPSRRIMGTGGSNTGGCGAARGWPATWTGQG